VKAGIVDQYVDAPEFELRLLENVDACFGIRHVHREDLDPRFVAQLLCDGLEIALASRNEHQVCTSGSEQSCCRRAYTFGPTGDDHRLVFENHGRSLAGLAGPGESRNPGSL